MVLGLEDLLKPELVSAGGPIEALLAANPFIPGYSLEKKRLHEMSRGFHGVEASQILASGVRIPMSEGGRGTYRLSRIREVHGASSMSPNTSHT